MENMLLPGLLSEKPKVWEVPFVESCPRAGETGLQIETAFHSQVIILFRRWKSNGFRLGLSQRLLQARAIAP